MIVVTASVFVLAGFLSLAGTARNGGSVYVGLAAVQGPFSWLMRPFTRIGDFFRQLRTLKTENEIVREQNRLLAEQIARSQDAAENAQFLRAGQTMRGTIIARSASVLGFSFGSGGAQFVIEGGSNQNIQKGDLVLIPDDILVGRVQIVRETTSVVQTVFDSDLKIAASIAGQVNGLFSFDQGAFALSYIPAAASAREGALVRTSGQDGIFPKGLLLGTLRSMQAASDAATQKALVDPLFSLSEVKSVVIVRNPLN